MTQQDKTQRKVRIGGASGFWGDSAIGAPQLVQHGEVDFLVFDYLAELTMSLLAGARLKNPQLGYATDFVSSAMAGVLPQLVEKNIRVVANAGGVNPQACADALAQLAERMGIQLRIAVVTGDDALPLADSLRTAGIGHMQTGVPLPEGLLSANAYLGAAPIASALDAGAQVVITGRCVDSAVTLGVLMHSFGWQADDLDRLAAGSLAGHILECGCQATGGLHTDWDKVPNWADVGYPIVECAADGSFVVTKPPGTGGLVSRATVGEQLLYEIGDPAAYLLPDVVCDFRDVQLTQLGSDRVRVEGARGRAPSAQYKVTATYAAGYRCNAELLITGIDAAAKAQRSGDALLRRTQALIHAQGGKDFTATHIDVIGAEGSYGPHATAQPPRQAVLRVAVTHEDKAALQLFAREIAAAGTSWAPGTTGFGGGRPSVALSIRQFPLLVDKTLFTPTVSLEGKQWTVADAPVAAQAADEQPREDAMTPVPLIDDECIQVPLVRLAYGRSGDKGDISNIGIMARHPDLLPWLQSRLSTEVVRAYMAHLVQGEVRRYVLPGIGALNFVCEEALAGGGMASLRVDPLGKGMAQILLSMPLRVPVHLLALAASSSVD